MNEHRVRAVELLEMAVAVARADAMTDLQLAAELHRLLPRIDARITEMELDAEEALDVAS